MNNPFCTKTNFQTSLTWLLLRLLRSVFGNSFVPYDSAKVANAPKARASFLFIQSALLPLPSAARLVPIQTIKTKQPGTGVFLQFRFPLTTNPLQRFKVARKNRAASHPAIHSLIQFFHVGVINIKSVIHQQIVIKNSVLIVRQEL
ncbi:MAG: hypothetical protein ACE3JK_14745 [Sporolactobacillus sp.]